MKVPPSELAGILSHRQKAFQLPSEVPISAVKNCHLRPVFGRRISGDVSDVNAGRVVFHRKSRARAKAAQLHSCPYASREVLRAREALRMTVPWSEPKA